MNRTIHAALSLALAASLVGACSKKRSSAPKREDAAAQANAKGSAAAKTPAVCGSTKACKQKGLCVAVKGRCVADGPSCRASERCKYLGYCGYDADRCARFSLPICRKGANEYCKARFGDGYSCRGGACSSSSASVAAPEFPSKLTRETIRRVIKMYARATRGCYERRLLRDPRLGGTLRVDFTINTEGKPEKVSVAKSSFEDTTLGQCVVKSVRAMKFPAPDKPKQIKYPFVFSANLINKLQILVGGKPLLRVDGRGVVYQGELRLNPLMVAGKEIWLARGMVKLQADGSVVDAEGKPIKGAKINARGELSLAGKVIKIGADGQVIGGAKKPAVQVKGAKTALDKQAAMLLYVYNVLPRLGGKPTKKQK